MVNVFLHNFDALLQRGEKISRWILDAKDVNWFWKLAAASFNSTDDAAVNKTCFRMTKASPRSSGN